VELELLPCVHKHYQFMSQAQSAQQRLKNASAPSSQVSTLPIAKSQTRSKQNKGMHKFGSV
jgi:hypothetical protein